jgi:[ribosomal protein S5]-alanine N-acetyltransferase
MTTYPLETERLIIRPVQETDAGVIAPLVTHPISRWTATWPPSISVEGVLDRIKSAIEAQRAGRGISLVIIRKSDGALMGWAGLYRNHLAPEIRSLGYWLGESFQGKGYMSEAVGAIISHAWSQSDIEVIEALAQPENGASIAILQKQGMHFAGERTNFAPARNRDERCVCYQVRRPSAAATSLSTSS